MRPLPLSPLQQDAESGLNYRVRLPLPPQPKACLVLLHGYGSHEQDLATLAADLPQDVLVVLAQGPVPCGPNQYAWFALTFTPQGTQINALQAESSRQQLLALLRTLQTQHQLEARHIAIAGFSQGGILSASVALSSPEHVGGFGLLSGRILPELKPLLAAPDRLKTLQTFVSHGQWDSRLPVQHAEASEALLHELGVPYAGHRYPAEHEITAGMQADFTQWLATWLIQPESLSS